jgi:hypothetical protein
MIKLITPPGMLLTTALLVIFSAYAFMIGWNEDSWLLWLGGILALIASCGVAMLRPWSRYLVYVLTAGFFAKLGHSVWYAHKAGFFYFQFGSASEAVASLVPSAIMGMFSLLCCYLVFRYFAGVHRNSTSVENRQAAQYSTESRTGS